jgi:hypothetical protein
MIRAGAEFPVVAVAGEVVALAVRPVHHLFRILPASICYLHSTTTISAFIISTTGFENTLVNKNRAQLRQQEETMSIVLTLYLPIRTDLLCIIII